MVLFADPLHDAFGTWPLAYIPTGGADFGEVRAVAEAVGTGDDDRFHAAWIAAATRLEEEAETTLARGHAGSARDLFLRASAFYGASMHPLYGAPVDPRLRAAATRQMAAFDRALGLGPHPVRPQSIPFDGHAMPAYLIPAAGRETETRPLIIFTNGYDGTIPDMYFASAVAASRCGYHSLLFDGPGQGMMLYAQNVTLRPDWETVVAAVMDFALAHPLVDAGRVALSGWSLGGYLAPRAASGEHRLAAVIADPGSWGIAAGFRAVVRRMFDLPPEAVRDLGALDPALLARAEAAIRADREMNWKVVQRGFWVHGVETLGAYLADVERYTMEGRAERITCPTLITQAEEDALAAGAGSLFAALRCPKTLLRFSAADGAGDHCEMQNRSLLNRRALDWLDEQFAAPG